MIVELLVDSAEYWSRLRADVAAARQTVVAQALTFEADAAGRGFADLLLASSAPDRRVVVDCFTWHVISDRLVWGLPGLLDPAVRAEARATRAMEADLRAEGVGVRFTNPIGPLFSRAPRRNHKKLVLVDGRVAYVGGINFSDHNFAWHDLMLRIEDPTVGRFLAEDFEATWAGRGRAATLRHGALTVHSLDGRSNEAAFQEVFALLGEARQSVFVECPYLTHPFCDPLRATSERGVTVQVVAPARNNWSLAGDAAAWAAATSRIDLRHYPAHMTHLKAMLVDGRTLVVGSANFDVWSARFQDEYLLVIEEPGLVAEFARRVVGPDLAASTPAPRMSPARQRSVERRLRAFDRLSLLWAWALPAGDGGAAWSDPLPDTSR